MIQKLNTEIIISSFPVDYHGYKVSIINRWKTLCQTAIRHRRQEKITVLTIQLSKEESKFEQNVHIIL